MKYLVIFLFLMGFIGIAYAMHDPSQPYTHSIILPPDVKGATFEEFMKWCEPYYKERCADMYEKNKTSKSPIPLKLNNLASELWYDHDYIIGGTILDIRGYGQSERVYDIQINSFFKPKEGTGSKVITVYGYPNFYNVKGDSGIFFIKKQDAKWVFGEYGAKATPECPPELMYHQPIEPQAYTRVPASGTNFDHMIDCYPHYYKKYLPQYMKLHGATQFPSPFSQLKDKVPATEVVCDEGLTLIQKYDDAPVCVTESTKQKLIERGWTKITSINLTLHDTQSWGYIKDISILDNDYVGITMSYPTNEAYHELYPDEHNSIIGNCDVHHDSAVLSILYLKDINPDVNTVTFTKEGKNFDGMSCNDAFWKEMTLNGYCGPPPHFMLQAETLTPSITDAQKMVDFALDVPKYLPAGYDVQKISVDSDRKRAMLFISQMPVTNETDMCKFTWADEGIYLSYVSLPEDTPRFGNDPKKERITINENRGFVEHRWVGDRFGTPIPQRSEIIWHVPEDNLVLDMLSSLPSEELIRIAESLE